MHSGAAAIPKMWRKWEARRNKEYKMKSGERKKRKEDKVKGRCKN